RSRRRGREDSRGRGCGGIVDLPVLDSPRAGPTRRLEGIGRPGRSELDRGPTPRAGFRRRGHSRDAAQDDPCAETAGRPRQLRGRSPLEVSPCGPEAPVMIEYEEAESALVRPRESEVAGRRIAAHAVPYSGEAGGVP